MSDADLESLLQRTPVEEPSPERRAELRSRVLDEFDKSQRRADASFALRLWKKGKRIMFHPITRTATLAAAVVLSFWVFAPSPAGAAAFSKLIKPLVEAKSAKYKAVATMEGQKEMTFAGYFLAPNRIRQENADVISIMDMDGVGMLTITPALKQALLLQPTAKKTGARSDSYFGDLRRLLEDYRKNKSMGVKDLGEKVIDGRQAFGFGFEQLGVATELWGDSGTGRLMRIEATFAGPPKWTVVMSDFEFDMPIDEKLFSMEPPAGYKVIKAKLKPGPATEEDLTATLKRLSELADGELPGGFDGGSMGMAFAKAFNKEAKGKQWIEEELYQMALELGRGMTFPSTLPAEADAHYAGRGVKTGGEAKPIFWYKPKGEGKYRVLSTDWKWTETDAAPAVKDAVKLGGFPKSAMKKNGK
jgi:outer membrane lipoprotein-sorting protein